MKNLFTRFSFAFASLLLILVMIYGFLDIAGEATTLSQPEKTAKCDLSGFDGFPKTIEGPVTLELNNLITVLVKSDDGEDSIEVSVAKSRCEVK